MKTSKPVQGFTLVELLSTIGIMVILMGLVTPALNKMQGKGEVGRAVYEIAGILDQARASAIANNTYVFVGFSEVDAGQISGTSTSPSGVGCLVMSVVAANDGTKVVDFSNVQSVAARSVQVFDNLHLADFSEANNVRAAASGPMKARMPIDGKESLSVGMPVQAAGSLFSWPLNAGSGNAKYKFSRVVRYSPEGVATFLTPDGNVFGRFLEVALQQSHGSVVPPLPQDLATGKHAVVQINGITGSTRIFRP